MQQLKKIVIIGGESTGKSTLCRQLAKHFNTVWVDEYARNYLENLNSEYTFKDLLFIAKGQIKNEKQGEMQASTFLFCDTDLEVIKVWSEHKFRKTHAFISEQIHIRKYDAYILTAPDFPWVYDKLREHSSQEMRNYFFEKYKKYVENTNLPFLIVKGNEKQRLTDAIQFIENTLK